MGEKAMTNIAEISICQQSSYGQNYGYASSHVWTWRLDHKQGWVLKNWCFQIVVFGEDSWTTRRSNQSILKEINFEYSPEGLMLKRKLQYFGHLMERADSLEKDPDAGKDWRLKEKGAAEDDMVGWCHQLNGHEFEQTPGDSEGQGSLACCSLWSCRVRHDSDWTATKAST